MRVAIITIEGVLSETSDLKSSPPTKLGKDFYDSLRAAYRVILFSNQSDRDLARYWLRKEGFRHWATLLCYPSTSLPALGGWKVNSVREMLGDGWDIAMVLDTNPGVHQSMLDEGVTSILVSYPAMATRPGRLPEAPGPLRPWDEIAGRVEEQNLLEQGG